MATSGSYNTGSVGNFYLTVSWTRTGTDPATYSHYIYYEVVAHNTQGNYRSIYDRYLSINGTEKMNVYTSSGTRYYDGDIVTSGNITITGTDSLYMYLGAGVGSYHGYNAECSPSWTLDSIPQQATITRADNFNSDGNPYMEFSNPGGLVVDCALEFGGTNIMRQNVSGSSCTFYLTQAERNLLYSKCSESNSLAVRFVVQTRLNGNQQWWSWLDRTMYVIDYQPNFSNFTYADQGGGSTALTGNNQIVIKGYNIIDVIISTGNKATAVNESPIKKYRAVCGSLSAEANYSSNSEVRLSLPYITSSTIEVYAIDGRGKSKKVSKTISSSNWKNYSGPILTYAYILRTNSLGTRATLSLNGTFWNNSFGSVTNTFNNFKYRYKKTSSSTYSDWINLTPTKSGNNYSFSANINGDQGAEGFDMSYSYNIQLYIQDKIFDVTRDLILAAGAPIMAIHRQGAAFGAPYNTSVGGPLQIKEKNLVDVLQRMSKRRVGEFTLWEGNRSFSANGSFQWLGTHYSPVNNLLRDFPLQSGYTRSYKLYLDYTTNNITNGSLYIQFKNFNDVVLQEYLFSNVWGDPSDNVRTRNVLDFDINSLGTGHINLNVTSSFASGSCSWRIYRLFIAIYDELII